MLELRLSLFIGLLLVLAIVSSPAIASKTVTATPAQAGATGPLAAFTYDSCEEQGCLVPGFPASFNASFSHSPNGPIVLYIWNFGDPSSSNNQFNSTNPSVAHDYLTYQNGSTPWKVTLTVKDSIGQSDTTVQMVSPQVYPKFTTQPSSPSAGEPVTFDGSSSTFNPSTNTTPTYSWIFGDGTNATGAVLNHTYSAAGTYRVILTVATAYGTGRVSKTVFVGSDPPANFDRVVWGKQAVRV